MEELEKFVMPGLLVATADDAAMVAVTNKGYAITHRGLEELDKRGIPHRGEEVVTEGGHHLDFGNWNPEDFGDDAAGKPRQVAVAELTTPPAAKITPGIVVPEPEKSIEEEMRELDDYMEAVIAELFKA